MTAYAVPHELSSPAWASAFAKGCNARIDVAGDTLQPGGLAMFGSPERWHLLERARAESRTWYYGDHAYFGRHEYFRVTRNAAQLCDLSSEGDADRWDRLGVRIRPSWNKQGKYILLCPNSPRFYELHGTTVDAWLKATTAEIRRHTDREIRVRFKTYSQDLEAELRWAWAVVVYTSMCGVHAALNGIACFATQACASRAFGSGDLSRIENPVRPDNRYEMATVLAANQWTLHEMSRGMAWSYFNERAE